MTLSDPKLDVRARTHIAEGAPGNSTTSQNAHSRGHLRVVPDHTHTETAPQAPIRDHAASDHAAGVVEEAGQHAVVATHPPTVAEAAQNVWLDPDETRHGLAGQLAALPIGLIQVVGLAVCWGIAHIFFASKTRTTLFLITAIATTAAYAVAVHA